MAITFNPSTKIIQLDSNTTSEKELWTAFVDWSVQSDNLKYGVGMTQIGGVAPIALYIYLELGWKIRPVEADGITTITGNVLVQGGGSPITSTLGNYNVLVNMETPVKASAIQVEGSPVITGDIGDIGSVVWSEPTRELTSGSGLDETALHTALDNYKNKADWSYSQPYGEGSAKSGISIEELNSSLEYVIGKIEAANTHVVRDINNSTKETGADVYANISDDIDIGISKMKDMLDSVKQGISNISDNKESGIDQTDLLKQLDDIKSYVSKTPLKDDIEYIRNQIDTYKEVDVVKLTNAIEEKIKKSSGELESQIISNFDSKLLKVSDDMKLLRDGDKDNMDKIINATKELNKVLTDVNGDRFEKAYDKLDRLGRRLADINDNITNN